ncbi:protein of unknown function [Sphingomonas gellani]|uniref:DUF4893 domain-containing protein n=1 Tax=Sphingomonas gellani TaxID=1166340 RepID=A0A1H8F0W7_9SPHN|nr:DUF4893 domain-containing protein [Sphingomonas gellani]SEN24737.1 protein of unknown function [Sphingomonas gellani]
MTIRGLALSAMLALALPGCASHQAVVSAKPAAVVELAHAGQTPTWQTIATPADIARIEALPGRLAQARAGVPAHLAGRMRAEGPLVDTDAAQQMPQLPPGSYYCRLLRFGGRGRFQAFAPDFCYVDIGPKGLSFTKQTGSNLPQGYLHPDGDRRQVFLGTMRTAGVRGGGGTYGQDASADQVGIVERVAPFRWRLIMDRAGQGAALDMYELVPVPGTVPGAKPATQPG